jgi:signal transduction histidine kinase
MNIFGRALRWIGWLRHMLGWQGLMIALITIVSFAFGIGMLVQEYTRPHQTRRDVLHSILSSWMRAPDYLGLNLLDYSARWRRDPSAENLSLVQIALHRLGEDLEEHDEQFQLITIVGLSIVARDGGTLAKWTPRHLERVPRSAETDQIRIGEGSAGRDVSLRVTYEVSPNVSSVFLATERYDDRLIEALIGLSGCSLLCFGYMVLYVQELRERVAREAAQEATLDLADRTCHELGNVAFVVANERRNLANHIELLERFVDQEREARAAAAVRVGLSRDQLARLNQALNREYEQRRIDPDFELRRSTQMARDICRQIEVCSDYITLTVQELDGYLKQSLTPDRSAVKLADVDVEKLFDEALALLAPRLEAADAQVERTEQGGACLRLRADRRLMVHVLVNLIKNAIEAVSQTGRAPVITLRAQPDASGTVRVLVQDNGPGIDRSIERRLFEEGVSTKGAGRGKGLAIVRESILVQGGTLSVESDPRHGTTFRIQLPRGSESDGRTHHGKG